MFKNLINKTFYDKRGFILGWSIGVAIMAAITIAFYPTIKDQIGQLFQNIPKALESITGSSEDYKSITGYVGTGVFDLRIPMLTITMAIILGLGLSVTEEYSGRMYLLLAQPIARTKIVWQKSLAMVGIFTIVHIVLAGAIAFVVSIIGESMALDKIIAGCLMCLLLTTAIGSITLGLGFALARKGLVTMLVTVYVFGSYLLTSFAAQIDWLKHIEPASVFHYYKASEALKSGYNLDHITVYLLISVVAILIGAIMFKNRDIGTHSA